MWVHQLEKHTSHHKSMCGTIISRTLISNWLLCTARNTRIMFKFTLFLCVQLLILQLTCIQGDIVSQPSFCLPILIKTPSHQCQTWMTMILNQTTNCQNDPSKAEWVRLSNSYLNSTLQCHIMWTYSNFPVYIQLLKRWNTDHNSKQRHLFLYKNC